MNESNPIADAVGTLKLVGMHLAAPTAYPAEAVRDAAEECIGRLQAIPEQAIQLAKLYADLITVTPRGWLPHVTLTKDAYRPFGAVITDEAENVAFRGTAKTIEGLVHIVKARLPASRGV